MADTAREAGRDRQGMKLDWMNRLCKYLWVTFDLMTHGSLLHLPVYLLERTRFIKRRFVRIHGNYPSSQL